MSDLEGDSDLFMESDSSDDNLDMNYLNDFRNKNENYLEEKLLMYEDSLFFEHFRVSRHFAHNIAETFKASEQFKRHYGQHGKISALNQVLIFLWYLGHQTASFRDVADRFDISISSLHRIINRVALYISNLSEQVITWPTDNEKIIIEQHFRENGFPNVIGAIDGCHIKIDKPEHDPDSYMNRKGYYSIQMQVVCDYTRKIRDIFVGYPGSVPNSRVFQNSPLSDNLEEICGRYYILGNSGYPLKTNMLTPYIDRGQLTNQQLNYNLKLFKNRYLIEQCFGILKQKFRKLYHVKLRSVPLIVHLIRAACVLHNMTINDEFLLNEMINFQDDIVPPQLQIDLEDKEEDGRDAKRIRDRVANALRI